MAVHAMTDQPDRPATDAADGPIPERATLPEIPRSWLGRAIDLARHRSRRRRWSSRFARYRAEGREPVLVYSHQRTGSMSLMAALRRSEGIGPCHIHTILPEHVRWRSNGPVVADDGIICDVAFSAEVTRAEMARNRLRFVVAVRDPVAVNISFFLYWVRPFWAPAEWDSVERMTDERLAQLFLERFPHHSSTRWIDREFSAVTGLSFGPDTFDRGRGAVTLANERAAALVLRTELPDADKTRELSEFLGRPITPIRKENSSEEVLAGKAELIARTRRVIAGIPGYVDALLSTGHAKRFWTDEQLEGFRRKWQAVAKG